MKIQQVLEEVVRASGVPKNRIGVAFTKASQKGLFVAAELESTEYTGENGVYGIGNQRRADTTISLRVTYPGVEGNERIYGTVTNEAESISANIAAYQVSQSELIDIYCSGINFENSTETAEEQIISAVVTVVATHDV